MTPLTCELCGSSEIVKHNGYYVCQNCGTKYSVEEAKKMMAITSDRIDDRTAEANKIGKLYQLARRARDESNTENAEKYYGMLALEDPTSWEAHFYQVYFKSLLTNIAGISNAAIAIANTIKPTFQLVKQFVDDYDKPDVVKEITERCIDISKRLGEASASTTFDLSPDNYYGHKRDEARYEQDAVAATGILFELEADIKEYFPDCKDCLLETQKALHYRVNLLKRLYKKEFQEELSARLEKEIKTQDPSYKYHDPLKKAGCYIATCVYGSYDCPQVWTLRRYRDFSLSGSWYGRAFIQLYYAISPSIVNWFGENKWFKRIWKTYLDKLVKQLQKDGFASTPYKD